MRSAFWYAAFIVALFLPWFVGAWAVGIVVCLALGCGNQLATWLGLIAVILFALAGEVIYRRLIDHV